MARQLTVGQHLVKAAQMLDTDENTPSNAVARMLRALANMVEFGDAYKTIVVATMKDYIDDLEAKR